jgi:hypothetical protein
MAAKKSKPTKAKKPAVKEGHVVQTALQTVLGLISYGIPYYFATAGTLEKQKKMLEAVKRKWGELAQELNSIREHQHSCPDGEIWCVQKSCCCIPEDCPIE